MKEGQMVWDKEQKVGSAIDRNALPEIMSSAKPPYQPERGSCNRSWNMQADYGSLPKLCQHK